MMEETPNSVEQNYDFSAPIAVKKNRSWLKKVFWVVAGFLILVLLCLIPIVWQGAKIAGNFFAVEKNLTAVLSAAALGDFAQAGENANSAKAEIIDASSRLGRLGPILLIPPINRLVLSSQAMLNSSYELISGYEEIFVILAGAQADLKMENVAMGFSQEKQRQAILESIVKNRGAIEKAKIKIDQAQDELVKVDFGIFPGFLRGKLVAASNLLNEAITNTEIALPIMSNLPELLGANQEKNYLFVFENNMELRPTGGFIGSYGIFTIKNGAIVKFFTDDVYNLDKFSKGKLNIPAPEPMSRYLGQKIWYMRDANWSPSWPDSAKQILWFFEAESKNAGLPAPKIDGVIAITPEFIGNLLSVVGPVKSHGLEFKAENFAADLEQFVEFDYAKYGISVSQRKAIIGAITDTVIERIYNLPPKDLIKIWLAFKKNIDEKNILVYLLDENLQKYFTQKNWSGIISPTTDDYLMVVDSNLGALKTDQAMKRSIDYELTADKNGDLIAKLAITYQHQQDALKDLISRYRDFARIYVPEGSWFLRAYLKSGNQTEELAIPKDLAVGSEFGKTVASVFFEVEPKTEKTLFLEYRLPKNIAEKYQKGSYNFSVQKQPGTIGHEFKINLNFMKPVAAYHSADLPSKFGGKSIGWETDLRIDREFMIKF